MLHRLDDALRYAPLWRGVRNSARLRRALGYENTLWTRKVADREVRTLVAGLEPAPRRVVEISGRVWQDAGFSSYTSVQYPAFDIAQARLPDSFDLVIAEHILEHVEQPERAAHNIRAMLSPGGHALIVTPFLYKVHDDPVDFTRWTEKGLRRLMVSCGFPLETIRSGSWGIRACVEATLRREFRLFNRYLHSLQHEPQFPVVVWGLARR